MKHINSKPLQLRSLGQVYSLGLREAGVGGGVSRSNITGGLHQNIVSNLFVEKVEGSFNSRKLKIKKSFISLKLGGEIH